MNILCCFKIVNDLDAVIEQDWLNADRDGVDVSYAKRVVSCYDEGALECALRVKDEAGNAGVNVRITAVTVGNGDYEVFFKNMFAVGIDRITQISTDEELPFSPERTAERIAKYVSDDSYDAVLTGMQSADGANGTTPYLLADMLGMPCINHVTTLHFTPRGLCVSFDTGWSRRSGTVSVPALFAVGNSECPYLRIATLREKLGVSSMAAQMVADSDGSVCGRREPCSLTREKRSRNCVILDGEDAGEKAGKLWADYLEGAGL